MKRREWIYLFILFVLISLCTDTIIGDLVALFIWPIITIFLIIALTNFNHILLIIPLLFNLIIIGGNFITPPAKMINNETGQRLKILTHNTKSAHYWANKLELINYYKKFNPDLICFQEHHNNTKSILHLENHLNQ